MRSEQNGLVCENSNDTHPRTQPHIFCIFFAGDEYDGLMYVKLDKSCFYFLTISLSCSMQFTLCFLDENGVQTGVSRSVFWNEHIQTGMHNIVLVA